MAAVYELKSYQTKMTSGCIRLTAGSSTYFFFINKNKAEEFFVFIFWSKPQQWSVFHLYFILDTKKISFTAKWYVRGKKLQ